MEKKKKHHFFIKFLFFIIIFSAVTFYAYSFPVTMDLIDKNINKIIVYSGGDFSCSVFSDFSDFAIKTVNKAVYVLEIIKSNFEEMKYNAENITPVVFSSFGDFPVGTKTVSSDFGKRKDPITGKDDIHTGIDIPAAEGNTVTSSWPGKIAETGYDKIYGKYILIEHSKGFFTKYCHLSRINVEKNEFVLANEKIGEAGNTGRSTGSHLHFEVIVDGRKIDPMECIKI